MTKLVTFYHANFNQHSRQVSTNTPYRLACPLYYSLKDMIQMTRPSKSGQRNTSKRLQMSCQQQQLASKQQTVIIGIRMIANVRRRSSDLRSQYLWQPLL